MTDAYRASSALEAEAALLALAAELDLPPKFHGTRDIPPRGSISDSEKRSKITLKSCGSITFNCNVFRRPNLYRLEKYGLINRVIESKHVTRSHFATATLWRYRYALCGVMDCSGVDGAAVVQPG